MVLLLAGGGVKGLAYVGVLQALSDAKIRVSAVIGTSAGAIVGGAVAVGYTAEELHSIMMDLDLRRFSDYKGLLQVPNFRLFTWGIHSGDRFVVWYRDLLSRKSNTGAEPTFSEIRIHEFVALSTDLVGEKPYPCSKRDTSQISLIDAVRASISYPFYFRPTKIGESTLLVDGGVYANLAAFIAANVRSNIERRFGSENVVAVYFKSRNLGRRLSIFSFVQKIIISSVKGSMDGQLAALGPRATQIEIDTGPITTFAFDLTDDEKAFIYNSGYNEACRKLELEIPLKSIKVPPRRLRNIRHNILAIVLAMFVITLIVSFITTQQTPETTQAEVNPPIEPQTLATTRTEVKDCPVCPMMVSLANNGGAAHFATSKPITVEEFRAFVNATAKVLDGTCATLNGTRADYDWQTTNGQRRKSDQPVTCVNWYDAQDYAQWLGTTTGFRYVLPLREHGTSQPTQGAVWGGDCVKEIAGLGCLTRVVFDQPPLSPFAKADGVGIVVVREVGK